ncbi:hypothetical protein A2761_01765 [Candidatus Kaiserbacteria bacterium RIFCSPHIGHO2_01_FULL_51_33]|nr:MAG: hypothetical protein A2761_01765 [Candidatus Kaiserbacteria bacterium RIFCSPHIGHO2_01_FULL_51_33]
MSKIPSTSELGGVAWQSGRIIKMLYLKPERHAVEFKADGTKVTAADRAVHIYVVKRMQTFFPDIPIVGEEGTAGKRTGAPDEHWLVVDELDGTHAFTLGLPVSAVMIALMEGDHPIRSAIADPFSDRLYTAELGKGAFLNGFPVRVQQKTPKYPVVDVVSWPHRGKNDMLIENMVGGVAEDLHALLHCEVHSVGGIGIVDARVASGEFSATVFPGTTLWDTAAGDLLVREAGGVATDLRGNPLRYDGDSMEGHVFAATADLHASILGVVRKYYP